MQRSANGVLILILGILSWVGFGCLTGIPAWIMGNQSVKDIQSGRADANEMGMVQAGRILGMINCILVFIAIGFYVMVIMGIVGLGLAGAAGSSR